MINNLPSLKATCPTLQIFVVSKEQHPFWRILRNLYSLEKGLVTALSRENPFHVLSKTFGKFAK